MYLKTKICLQNVQLLKKTILDNNMCFHQFQSYYKLLQTHQTSVNRAICSEFDFFVTKVTNLVCLDKFLKTY